MMKPALYFIRRPAYGSGRAGFAIALFIAASLNLVTTASNASPTDEKEMQFRCLTRGGMINAVEGEVLARIGRKDWQKAYARIELRNGDRLKTGSNSRAELLLNPGSFLRLSENTEVVYVDTSVTNLKLRLLKGEVTIEVAVNDMFGHLDSAHSLITVLTSRAEYAILPGGIYRFRIGAGGTEEVKVRKGRVVVNGAIVRDGKRAVISNSPPVIYDFDRDESDRFDEWSRARAKLLVQVNKTMKEERWYDEMAKGKRAVFVEERTGLQPQIKNQYVVSARAGAVKHVEHASFKRGEEDWSTLAAGYDLREGDEVKIDEGSRAEIMLSPDSYLRLSGDTRMQFSDTTPDNVSFELLSGSAIIESAETGSPGAATVRVKTPRGECAVASGGIYRFQVEPSGRSEVIVRRGQAQIAGLTVREGKKVVFEGSTPRVVEFNRDAHDGFDVWSRYRAELLALPNRRLLRNARSLNVNRSWYCGLWFYSSAYKCYTFVPGYWDFHNPYGGGYSIKFVRNRLR